MISVIIDLRELQEGENEYRWEEAPEALHIEDVGQRFVGPIRTRMTVFKLGEALSAAGKSTFCLRMECDRCLEPFDLPLSAGFSFVFQKGRPASVKGDEDETLIWLDDRPEKLDLGDEVKDYIILEIPQHVLCSESCAGLCPLCGANLNLGRCTCKTETVDPRWEALRALKGGSG